jgi:hypothetical protein
MKHVMTASEVTERLSNIRAYNRGQIAAGQPHHCMTVRRLAAILIEWGADPKRARLAAAEPAPSPILAEIAARLQPEPEPAA